MWLALSLALADPPEGVDRDDTDRWEAMSDAALNGPEGCWELSGDLSFSVSFLSKASFWRRTTETPRVFKGTWNGTLDHGMWTRFHYTITEGETDSDFTVYPVVGEIDPAIVVNDGRPDEPEADPEAKEGDSKEVTVRIGKKKKTESEDGSESAESGEQGAVNLVRRSLEAWDTSTAISMAQWRDDIREIELIQDTPIKDKPNAPTVTLTTRIPEGEWVSRLSAVFPRKLTLGEWPLTASLHDMQFHLVQRRIGDHTFPAAENVSAVGTAFGFTLSYEQRLDYRNAGQCEAK